jgi:endonuclease/exonuclease/phosphatase family metal-dependent hydrolase
MHLPPLLSRTPALMLLLAALALLVAAPAQAQLRQPGVVTVASYNVQNFFDVFDDPYTDDEGADVKPRGQVEAIAAAIAALDADIVCFQELENEHLLHAMSRELLADRGYVYIGAVATNSGRGINLGVMSRVPIVSMTSHRWQTLTHPDAPGRTWMFARDLMKVKFDVGGTRPLTVFNVHLKSNHTTEGDEHSILWRSAEALAVREAVKAELAADREAWVLAVGDFNSDYQRQPHDGRDWPAMALLRKPEPRFGPVLIDTHDGLPRDARITLPGSGRYPPVVFDYILATPALAQRMVPGSAKVLTDPALTAGSDHRPLVTSFRVK